MAELHVLKYLCGVRGGRRHQEAIVRKAGSRAVVHDETILAQHHAITCPADCERRPVIDVEPVEEESGIRSLHIDLAERRHITEANGGADVPHLAVHRLQPIAFARAGKILSAQPEASSSVFGTSIGLAVNPAACAACAPTRKPSERQAASVSVPFAAPATIKLCGREPGTNAAMASFHTGRPP